MVTLEKKSTSTEGWGKMIFDNFDFEFLRLIGISKYIPTGLYRKYDMSIFDSGIIYNLLHHRLIKMSNDRRSYKLTKRGRDSLKDMGFDDAKYARTDIKRGTYVRLLKNGQWNLLLTLAGIDIYCENARQLAETECRYLSSLFLRADDSVKVLAGTKFLGILKIADIVYIPYFVENTSSWILPSFEKEVYEAQTDSIGNIKAIRYILVGESLEELWGILHTKEEISMSNGRKTFKRVLEECANEYILVPFGRDGVMQMSILKDLRYRERLAHALGLRRIKFLSECDGIKDKTPYIIAIDCNIRRIIQAIEQIERYDNKLVPRVCCLSFQKSIIIKVIRKYKLPKTIVTAIPKEVMYTVFPELCNNKKKKRKPCMKEGEYIGVGKIYFTNDEKADIPEL